VGGCEGDDECVLSMNENSERGVRSNPLRSKTVIFTNVTYSYAQPTEDPDFIKMAVGYFDTPTLHRTQSCTEREISRGSNIQD
jgi:hypothetical protein